jgi:cell shape-determining protein MreC
LVIVNTKKILVLAGVALLVFFLVTQPTQSAGIVTSIINTLKNAAEALILFVRHVFDGKG